MHRLHLPAAFSSALACSLLLAPTGAAPAQTEHSQGREPHAEWGYAGDNGPERWADLGADYKVCAAGREESPIDLRGAIPARFGPLTTGYRPVRARLVNNGHTVQMDVPAGQTMSVHGRRYELLQFHIHHPSEHLLAGRRFPLEFHLVHRGPDGALGVVAAFAELGAPNAALAPLFVALPGKVGASRTPAGTFDPTALLPSARGYLTYEGSLTTPPCTENVDWFVLEKPIAVGPAQVDAFEKLYPANARPIQRQFRRFVLRAME